MHWIKTYLSSNRSFAVLFWIVSCLIVGNKNRKLVIFNKVIDFFDVFAVRFTDALLDGDLKKASECTVKWSTVKLHLVQIIDAIQIRILLTVYEFE